MRAGHPLQSTVCLNDHVNMKGRFIISGLVYVCVLCKSHAKYLALESTHTYENLMQPLINFQLISHFNYFLVGGSMVGIKPPYLHDLKVRGHQVHIDLSRITIVNYYNATEN